MSLPNPGMSFTPFDPLTAAEQNDLVENIEALADGSGLDDSAIATAKIADGAVSAVLLDAQESTDFQNGTALPATTWTDFKGNQNFTVTTLGSVIAVTIAASTIIGGSTIATISARIVIDSGGTPINKLISGITNQVAAQYNNPFLGATVYFTGLSVGVHTIKTQVYSSGANTMYCRALTNLNTEHYRTTIVEIKK